MSPVTWRPSDLSGGTDHGTAGARRLLVNSDGMLSPNRTAALIVVTVMLVASSWAALRAQTDTQPAPPPTLETEAISPTPVPLVAPDQTSDLPDPTVKMDGRVRVIMQRWNEFEWHYRVDNGTDEIISSLSLAVPKNAYDSRVLAAAPRDWVAVREPGQGPWKDSWLVSYFANSPDTRLKPGKWMQVAVNAGAQLVVHSQTARVICGTTPATSLLFPWQDEFFPLRASLTDVGRKATTVSLDVPYPSLSFLPLPSQETSIPLAVRDGTLTARVTGQGVHYGRVFQMTIRSPRAVVGTLARGTVLVPSLSQYDVMIVSQPERLILRPHDIANIVLRGYSISYGRKAPPPRVVLHNLAYDFADREPTRELEVYGKILARAVHLAPTLNTPLGADYLDMVVQWALWRAQRLMEANPLSIRDLERDLSQFFIWRQTLKGPIRVYLQPLEIFKLARQLWFDTEQLMHEETAPLPIP